MKRTFFEHVAAAIATGALVLPGCGSDSTPVPIDSSATSTSTSTSSSSSSSGGGGGTDDAPPIIVSARFVTDRQIRVQFSEGVASVSNVDPEQFRLSLTRFAIVPQEPCDYYRYDYEYEYSRPCGGDVELTIYEDAGLLAQDEQNPFVALVNDVNDTHAAAVLLDLESPFGPSLCALADAYASKHDAPAGLMIHYSKSGSPIVDLQGNELDGLGGAWVNHPDERMGKFIGTLPHMFNWVRIPCSL